MTTADGRPLRDDDSRGDARRLGRPDTVLLGTGLGLYLSRVLAEFGPLRLATMGVAAATVLTLGLSITLLALARRKPRRLSPLALCYAYVLYPRIHPDLALAVALVVLIALFIANRPAGLARLPWELITAVAGLALYWHTLAPTLLPADSGEYQLVARTLGIAHPPGYPLYTLLGWAFTLLPLGDAAYRLNLMSAVLAALTLAVITRTVRLLTGSLGPALVAALALAGATTFWAQATTANIRSLTALFTALLLLLLIRLSPDTGHESQSAIRNSPFANSPFANSPFAIRHSLFALTFGLAVTHHGSLAFLALPFGLYLLATGRRALFNPRLLLRIAGAFLLGCSPLLYLPLRAAMGGAPLDPGGLTSVAGFLNHVLARGFRGDVLYFTSLSVLPDRLAVLRNILDLQFGPVPLGLALLGVIALARHRPTLALLLGGTFAVNALVAITYRAPQTVEYLMPAYVALVLLVGYGASALGRMACFLTSRAPFSIRAVVIALLFLPALGNLRDNYPSFAALSHDTSARDYAATILRDAPTGSTILSNWHHATAFWYLQTVEGVRPEVPVRYAVPQGAEPIGETWRNRLVEAVGRGPVVVTNRYNEYAGLPYRLTPFHGAFLAGGDLAIPSGIHQAGETFGHRFRLLGYQGLEVPPGPGSPFIIRLYWQPLADADRDYAFFVHLADGSGQVWGQYDRTRRAEELRAGEILADEAVLPVLPAAPPGTYTLLAGVYITVPEGGWQRLATEGGGDSLALGQVEIQGAADRPATAHRWYQPFQGGPVLLGVDYDTSRPEGWRVYLHWRLSGEGSYQARLWSRGSMVGEGRLLASGRGVHLTTAHDVPVGSGPLVLSLHQDDGRPLRALGPWGRAAYDAASLPRLQNEARWLSFGGEMALTRAAYRVDGASQEVVVDLTWVGLRPLVRDYSVSVQLVGEGWSAQHDSTPALGAIPTLKWLRGTVVRDRHRVKLPPGAAGLASLRLAVYDAFTLEPLVILDDRLLRLGQGQLVELP